MKLPLRFLCLLLLITTGCAGGQLYQPHEVVTPVVSTNAPARDARGQSPEPTLVTNYVTNIVFTVNPAVTGTLGTAKDIAQDVGGPWGTIVGSGIGLVLAALSFIAKRKSDQKAALLPAIITGVESAANNQEVKEAIEKVARAAGVESKLNALVQKITK